MINTDESMDCIIINLHLTMQNEASEGKQAPQFLLQLLVSMWNLSRITTGPKTISKINNAIHFLVRPCPVLGRMRFIYF
jgi:hypothetical protein